MNHPYELLYRCQTDTGIILMIDPPEKRNLKDWHVCRDDTELWVADVSADGSLSGQRKVGRLLNR